MKKEKVMKILVVDDKNENLEAAKKQLAEHELTTSSTFEETKDLIENVRFDVIMTDVMMPAKKKARARKEADMSGN